MSRMADLREKDEPFISTTSYTMFPGADEFSTPGNQHSTLKQNKREYTSNHSQTAGN